MNVVTRTLAAVAVVALLVPAATAQDRGWWRETAARESQRAREAQRAEFIRAQYERRRSMAHARLRSGEASTLYASTLSAADVQLSCPVEPASGMRNVIDLVIDGRHDPASSAGAVSGRPGLIARFDWPGIFTPVVSQVSPAWDFDTVHAGHTVSDGRGATASASTAASHGLPFLPSASDARGRQGIARVLNRSAEAGEVRIVAVDDSGRRYGPLTFFLAANETAQVTSADIENGNADKGLFGATGPGVGDWRLEFSSALDIEALSYVRASDGLLTAMHDVAPSEGTRHRVPFFNAASDFDQESRLRLINPGGTPAEVAITGIDSQGASFGDGAAVTLPPGASLTYTAAELESGRAAGLRGSLGDGAGEWRLIVESEQPLQVMSLVSSSTGHLTNLSTVPSNEARGAAHQVPLFPPTSDPLGRQGLVRVVNRSATAGEVRVKAHDDTQWDYAPLVLPIGAGETVHFDSNDLEQGNPGKGLSGGTGSGQGDWRLELTSDVDIEVLSYVRAWDGLLTAMHDVVPSEAEGTRHRVAMFNSESSPEQERVLRLINPGSGSAEVAISGMDAQGRSLGDGVAVTLPAGAARTYTAEELQTGAGAGLRGPLGDGAGEWRLTLESEQPLQVMSLLSSPAGHLSNLSTAPVLVPKTPPPVFATDTETPEDVFRTEVSPIVQAKCILCHRAGGFPADAPNSRLQFNPSTVEGHVALNLAVFEALIAVLGEDEQIDDPVTYILNKVQGVGHGGSLQLTAGTDNYLSLERFLGLLGEAVAPVGITPETLFEGVTMESPRQTLWRAALVFAGRVPTDGEYASIQGAGEVALRAAIRGLMTGPQFHEFLIRASNDRLFTDRELGNDILSKLFVKYTNTYYDLRVAAGSEDNPETAQNALREFRRGTRYATARAPLELIAHVIESDLPYTEILTADYIMANPVMANAYGDTTKFVDPTNVHEFKPSRIVSYYRDDDSKVAEYSPMFGHRVIDPGNLATDYPHAGILNTTAFLKRYPSTATNRNRARSRWTYYQFLGLDIEKSASRTTNPVALADTNNPTMHNSACTVCHSVLDPIAGAFQNYGNEGWYKDQWGGMDSLDGHYKDGSTEQIVDVEAETYESRETVSAVLPLSPGGLLAVRFRNDYWDEASGDDRNVYMDRLVVREQESGDSIFEIELEHLTEQDLGDGDCRLATSATHFAFYTACRLRFEFEVPIKGTYRVQAVVWADQVGSELAKLSFGSTQYRDGDTWYRDMRSPGFDGQLALNPDNSLQWLAQRIVANERFAEAAVKFWWPAIMGGDVAKPPENQTDADFEGLLLASNAQAAEATRLANGFRSGFHDGSPYNLKDLLVEFVLSGWFRAESVSGDNQVRTTALGGAGARRLLTPEELARKTLALTGFQWGRSRGPRDPWAEGQSYLTNSHNRYGLLYGGIDSDGITERARDFTSVMAGVAQAHALQSSYAIVMREFFLLPDEERLLFGGVNRNMSPVSEFSDTFQIEATSRSEIETLSVVGHLPAGETTVQLAHRNSYFEDTGHGHRGILLDRLTVRSGDTVVYKFELEDLDHPVQCHHIEQGAFHLSTTRSECVLGLTVDIPSEGTYTVEVLAWADRAGDELAQLEIAVESDSERSAGGKAIRSTLLELFDKLHGNQVTADSSQVRDAYELFVEVWERKRGAYRNHFMFTEENIAIQWPRDQHFFDGIADELWREELNEDDRPLGWDWDRIRDFVDTVDWSDPQAVARTWTVVLAYLMMDYRYLYL